jgi:hypothetical protein
MARRSIATASPSRMAVRAGSSSIACAIAAEACGPVIAVAGVDGGASRCEMGLRAVAVPLDLIRPGLTGRWPFNLSEI